MKSIERWLVDLDSEAEWEVWYQDTFDRECPRQIEVAGQGLVEGLIELWIRHLSETVQANGQKGFSRFNLWWKQRRKSIKVVGEWKGKVRLREWVIGDKRRVYEDNVGEGNRGLLMRVAATHSCLILAGQTSEGILTEAKEATSREDFESRLSRLEQRVLRKMD